MKPIRIELPNQLQVEPVNVYLFTEPEPVLIDTGPKSEADWAALQSGLAAHGLTVADLSRVIITHAHVDHFGQAAAIATHSDAEIWVSEVARDWLVNTAVMWDKRIAYYQNNFLPRTGTKQTMVDMVLRYMHMNVATSDSVPADRVHVFALDATLEIGGLPWQTLYTPGHTRHQTCFYQPETRQFLAGDMLLHRTPTPVVERPLSGTSHTPGLPQFLDSLDLVEALDVDVAYPGHGDLIDDHRQLIQRQRARILRRKAECLQYVRDGCDTAVAIVASMYGDRSANIQFAGLWMVIGYLDLLFADDLVQRELRSGVYRYKAVVRAVLP